MGSHGTSPVQDLLSELLGSITRHHPPRPGDWGPHRRERSFGLRRSHDRGGGRRGQRGDASVLRLRPVRRVPGDFGGSPPPEIRQIKRADGALVTSVDLPTGSFVLPTSYPGDVECDPVTFAVSQSWHPTIRNKDVLWVKDTDAPNPHKVYAMELPFAACGPVPPPPTSAANLCDRDLDTDGDGLPDCWENGTWWAGGLPGIALDGVYTPGRADTS